MSEHEGEEHYKQQNKTKKKSTKKKSIIWFSHLEVDHVV